MQDCNEEITSYFEDGYGVMVYHDTSNDEYYFNLLDKQGCIHTEGCSEDYTDDIHLYIKKMNDDAGF